MIKRSNAMLIVAAGVLILFAASCCAKKEALSGDRGLVARINNYEMTVGDFKDEARTASVNRYASGTGEAAKEELLEEMITRNVLLQEAQEQNFDKDKAFMKEIERYWEQALLKLLIKKKSAELARTIRVMDEEVRGEYERMIKEGGKVAPYEKISPEIRKYLLNMKMQGALDAGQMGLRKSANVKIYKENLKAIRLK